MKTLIQFPRVKTYDVRAHGVSPAFVEEAGFVQKRILIVDDNPGMLKLMRLFVNSDPDFQVCGEAFDGLDAVEKALDLKPI